MEFNALVDEIVARVAAKMADAPSAPTACSPAEDKKPGLLVLTQAHGTVCHEMLESARLQEYYHTDCALLSEYQCDIADYEAVILFDLTVEAMSRLAGGVCDTPFTALAQKAILSGKKIFVPQEEIELFSYVETVPAAYYQMLLEKLTLLKQSGLTVCPAAALEDVILSGEAGCDSMTPVISIACAPTKTARIDKRIITERDIAAVYDRSLKEIHIGERSILTDLAKEYAATRSVAIVRD